MKLVTFGCSWTRGIGIPYYKGMSREEYEKTKKTNKEEMDKYSFRGILSERLGYTNINFSCGGSSNQRQFRFAREYFNHNSKEDTVVLWGITSVARNEIVVDGMWRNFLYTHKIGSLRWIPQETHNFFLENYDEQLAITNLQDEMLHWNQFFEAYNIPNLWFQTFNTYKLEVDRLFPRDMLSHLTRPMLRDTHESNWAVDSKRISEAERKGLVNPYSLHPTKETHIKIADILEKPLREIL